MRLRMYLSFHRRLMRGLAAVAYLAICVSVDLLHDSGAHCCVVHEHSHTAGCGHQHDHDSPEPEQSNDDPSGCAACRFLGLAAQTPIWVSPPEFQNTTLEPVVLFEPAVFVTVTHRVFARAPPTEC